MFLLNWRKTKKQEDRRKKLANRSARELLMEYHNSRRRKGKWWETKKDRKRKAFIKNGGELLKALVAFSNGRGNPIRIFSAKDLQNATNNYDDANQVLRNYKYNLYKGFLQDRPMIGKKYCEFSCYHGDDFSFNEIVIASEMKNHKNVQKLLGCCLETEIPSLVFECIENGNLGDHLYNRDQFRPLLWKERLKIAVDIANVVAYLHTAFPRPVVHRYLIPENILLDEDYTAKLSEFSLSNIIPAGETHINTIVCGQAGFLAPEYALHGMFNEKSDVYSFGMILLALLTGTSFGMTLQALLTGSLPFNCNLNYDDDDDDEEFGFHGWDEFKFHRWVCIKVNNGFNEIIDPEILKEGTCSEQQLQAFAALALECTRHTGDERPEMIDVGKQLIQLYQSYLLACN